MSFKAKSQSLHAGSCVRLVLLPMLVYGLDLEDFDFQHPETIFQNQESAPAQWEDCVTDQQPRDIAIGVAVTQKLYSRFNSKPDTMAWVDSVVNGANFVYMSQLNIRLTVTKVYFGDANEPWSNDTQCAQTVTDKLDHFLPWTPDDKDDLAWTAVDTVGKRPAAALVLFDNCLDPFALGKGGDEAMMKSGLSGKAFEGTLCESQARGVVEYSEYPLIGDITWRVFAHEVGHIFGGMHPANLISVFDAGIMGYSTGHYKCELGFTPENKNNICPLLGGAIQKNCKGITVSGETRETFIASLPGAPKTINLNVIDCGFSGMNMETAILFGVALLCCCCCFCFCCCCLCGAVKARGSALSDHEEESEVE